MDKVIYCKNCKFCDIGINEDKLIFYKCLSGHSYGGTSPYDFCSHAEPKITLDNILAELHSAAAYGLTFNIKQVPIQTNIVINIIELLENKNDSTTIN